MNYSSDSSSPPSFSLDKLVKMNSQSIDTLEREPYRPLVYAIPETMLTEHMNLLKQAVKFQPTLYSQISTLATRKEILSQLQQMQETEQVYLKEALRTLVTASDQAVVTMKQSISQDGKNREKSISEISAMVDSARKDMQKLVSELRAQTRKLVIRTTMLAAAVSVLVCVVWQNLVS